jgi:hypothetical protein
MCQSGDAPSFADPLQSPDYPGGREDRERRKVPETEDAPTNLFYRVVSELALLAQIEETNFGDAEAARYLREELIPLVVAEKIKSNEEIGEEMFAKRWAHWG